MRALLVPLLLLSSVFSAGCGFHAAPIAAGGAIGTGVGAGTGAIIGSVIANGDVAASALLGGAIGLPVGLVAGGIYDYYSTESVRERKLKEIDANQKEIFSRQRQIDRMRDNLRNDGPSDSPPEELEEYQYNGATLGNYYR